MGLNGAQIWQYRTFVEILSEVLHGLQFTTEAELGGERPLTEDLVCY